MIDEPQGLYSYAGSIFLYLCQTSSGILQGTGYVKTVFFTTLISSIIRLGGLFFLGSRPGAGLEGIVLSYLASFFTLAMLNLTIIKLKTGFRLEYSLYLRLLLGGFVLVKLLHYSSSFIQDSILNLVVLTMLNALLFFLLLYLTGDKYTRLILQHIKK